MGETLPFPTSFTNRTASGIAQAIGRLISTGDLTVGTRLPTVRAVAGQLGVSPTTVAEAWRILQHHGAIATEGRRGTFVRGARQVAPGRYWQVPVDPGTFDLDLSTGTPDPALLPPLGPLLRRIDVDHHVTSYLDAPVVPALAERLRAGWPFEPELLTVVDGAQDALDRLVGALVGLGDAVVVTDPEFPTLLDRLELAGARILSVDVDDEGPVMAELEEAMVHEPVAVFLQPRSHNPLGVTVSAERAAEVATLIADRPVIVVEDDHSASVSGAPLNSVGVHRPEQVVHIRSFSKSHGPDLRLAAVGGAAGPIDSLARRRRLGSSWSSRLLQQLLLVMLDDPATEELVAEAADEYERRRGVLSSVLAEHGVEVRPGAGLNLWIPVVDEQVALINLATRGVGAAPGMPFRTGHRPTDPHLRVSVGTATGDLHDLGRLLALAARANPAIGYAAGA
ncbi:MAG: aminotransferase class I/II-fold pyridoxal phosphate-dependent enzyme [Actinomycetota bacterium]